MDLSRTTVLVADLEFLERSILDTKKFFAFGVFQRENAFVGVSEIWSCALDLGHEHNAFDAFDVGNF